MIERMPAQVNTASLHAIDRVDGSPFNNADIMQELQDSGRNFVDPDDAGAEDIADIFATELERRIQRILNKPSKVTDPKGLAKLVAGVRAFSDQEATACAAGALTKAFRHYMKMVAQALSKGEALDGSVPKPVTEDYAHARHLKFQDIPDDPTMVGRASGDLLDNVAHGTSAIRLTKE